MKETKRPTIGKISSDLIVKQIDDTHSAEDQMRESLTDWDRNIYECIERGKNLYPFAKEFYIEVTTKRERLMANVLRNYFCPRLSCPTPTWDQTVYHVSIPREDIKFIWVVPSQDTCAMFKENAVNIPPEEHDLLKFVLDFDDGTLLKLAKKLNGEQDDSPLLDK